MVDADGTPTILYTGVRLRSNPDCGPLPPPEHDLNLPFVESQLAAVPEAGALLHFWPRTSAVAGSCADHILNLTLMRGRQL